MRLSLIVVVAIFVMQYNEKHKQMRPSVISMIFVFSLKHDFTFPNKQTCTLKTIENIYIYIYALINLKYDFTFPNWQTCTLKTKRIYIYI